MQDCPHDFQVWAFNMLSAEPQACITSFLQTMMNAASLSDSSNTAMRYVRVAALFTYLLYYIEHVVYGVNYDYDGTLADMDEKGQVGNGFMFIAQHIAKTYCFDASAPGDKTLLSDDNRKNSAKRFVQYVMMLHNIRLLATIMATRDPAGKIHETMDKSPSMGPFATRLANVRAGISSAT